MRFANSTDNLVRPDGRYTRRKDRQYIDDCDSRYYDYDRCRCDEHHYEHCGCHCGNCCCCCAACGHVPSGPFMSSYFEALGNAQAIGGNSNVVFDIQSVDSVGNNITLDSTGTVFTINRTGLYHIEWNVNLEPGTASAVIGIAENGKFASGAASSTGGSHSSGTLVNVTTVPFTISLFNFENDIAIENPAQWVNSAVSIRIVRFADGPGR